MVRQLFDDEEPPAEQPDAQGRLFGECGPVVNVVGQRPKAAFTGGQQLGDVGVHQAVPAPRPSPARSAAK